MSTNRNYVTALFIKHAGYVSSLFPAGTPSCKRVFLYFHTRHNPLKSDCVQVHLRVGRSAVLDDLITSVMAGLFSKNTIMNIDFSPLMAAELQPSC